MIRLELHETATAAIEQLVKQGKDLAPAMAEIKRSVFSGLAVRSWGRSGLHVQSGELLRSITPFSGKVSAGIGLRSKKGRDLVWPKAVTHTFGRKKGSSKRRMGRNGKYRRLSPWGDIPARPFIPVETDVRVFEQHITRIIEDHLNAQTQ